MRSKLLEVNELSIQFFTKNGLVTAVNNVTFDVNIGEIFGIVGESGCGKTVTSLSLMQLLPPENSKISSGEINFLKENLLEKSKTEMQSIRGRDISMIFQDSLSSLNPAMKVGKQIIEAIRAHQRISKNEAESLAIKLMRQVGIPLAEKRFHEYPHHLSGGMRQRIVIAMALSCNAKLVIADEPTTSLDVTIQSQVLDLLQNVLEDGKRSLILITHDMGVIANMAHRVMVMYAGRVMEISKTKDIFENPLHPYTSGLLASIPKVNQNNNEKLYVIPGSVPALGEITKGCLFFDRCDKRMSICRELEPELVNFQNRQVRCHLYSRIFGEE